LNPELDADWLDGTSVLDATRFRRILSVVSRVTEGKALVDRAVATLGHGDVARLETIFSICRPGDAGSLSGKTDYFAEKLIVLRGETYAAQIAAHKAGPDTVDARVTEGPDYATIERWILPKICVQPGLPLRSAAETVAHELEHAVERDPRAWPVDPATSDARTYVLGYVQIKGDEVDGHLVGARIRIALDGNRGGVHKALVPFLDATGNAAVSRDRLAQAIVDPSPDGLGYGSGILANALTNARTSEARFLMTKRAILSAYATMNDATATQMGAFGQKTKAAASRAAEARVRAELPAIDARLRLLGAS
jgi:hypothetical protein